MAAFCFVGGAWAAVAALTFPQQLAQHPVSATATVTGHFIDGFGGDPNVNYRYTVHGRTYSGYGTAALGDTPALSLHVGDPVAIYYARDAPGDSCTCNPAASADRGQVAVDAVFMAPLFALTYRSRRKRRARRRGQPDADSDPN